jgi:hypothetical protein
MEACHAAIRHRVHFRSCARLFRLDWSGLSGACSIFTEEDAMDGKTKELREKWKERFRGSD